MHIGAGEFKGRTLPRARGARPVPARLKTSLFSVLADRLGGARVLDCCAGVGGLGFEALSRGAAHVLLLERDAAAARALGDWISAHGLGARAGVRCMDALAGPLPDGPFDLVFLDPPFSFWSGGDVAGPLARTVARLAPGGLLAVKLPARTDLPDDARWHLARRNRMGSVAYALLEATEGGTT
jgi:16S rRNA (guanine966-N2)-methyltransferase